ncbi:hypothetical protein ACT4UT_34915, partial [Bacillus sp. B-TM1]
MPDSNERQPTIVLTAVLSVANSGLYATSRMLWSMSNQG